jgi:hypothetical protein
MTTRSVSLVMAQAELRPFLYRTENRGGSRIAGTAIMVPTLLASILLLGSCRETPPTPSFLTRDSAGITIVESTSPRWSGDDGWTVDLDPLLDLTTSGSGPDHEFYRVADCDLSISAEDMAHEKAGWLGPNSSQERQEIVARIPIPDTKPAYSSLHVDPEGNIWAEEYRQGWWAFTDNVLRSWTVFNPDGEWLGKVRLPPRFTVYQIGSDYILGLAWDDMDVERIRVLRLNKG